jgi:hypothetical protein
MVDFVASKRLLDMSTEFAKQLTNKRLIGIFLTVIILFIPRLTDYNDTISVLAFLGIVPYWVYYFNWKNKESKVIKELHEAEYEVAKIIIEIEKIDKLKESGLMSLEDYLNKKQEYQNIYDQNKRLFLS